MERGSTGNAEWTAVENCVINLWTGAVTVEGIRGVSQFIDQVAARERRPVAFLVVIGRMPLVGKVERAELERFYTYKPSRFSAVAQVIDGSGMWASAVLGVATALGLLQRRSYPTKAFQSVDAAATWLLSYGKLDGARQQIHARIVSEVDRMRESIGEATSASAG